MARSPSLVKTLEKAVNTAFLAAGFTPSDLGQGQINLTDLPWSNPPLFCLDTVSNIPLTTILERPAVVEEKNLAQFWRTGLHLLYHSPERAIDRKGIYLGAGKVLLNASNSQHRFRFSTPTGFPKNLDEYSGAIFSMELATLISESLPYGLNRDYNNYYVTIYDGTVIGIKNGYIATESPWDSSVAGIAMDLAEMPRGEISTECQYDALAKIRSLLHEYPKKFKEFQGIDYALQTLRILYQYRSECAILARAVKLKKEEPNIEFDKQMLLNSIATFERKDISDRAKLDIIYSLLVPRTMSEASYKNKIYRARLTAPSILSDRTISRIISNLKLEVEELPL